MRRWADFEQEAPELAALGRERIEQFGFVFLGTVRKDGGPRVNPAEAFIVEGHLALSLIPGSLKARDLLRDPRAFLHTPVVDRHLGAPGEFKLRGHAVLELALPEGVVTAPGAPAAPPVEGALRAHDPQVVHVRVDVAHVRGDAHRRHAREVPAPALDLVELVDDEPEDVTADLGDVDGPTASGAR